MLPAVMSPTALRLAALACIFPESTRASKPSLAFAFPASTSELWRKQVRASVRTQAGSGGRRLPDSRKTR